MKMKFFLAFWTLLLVLSSCARVGSPDGGARDTLAPKYLGSNLPEDRVRVPLTQRRLRLNFNEYVQLKNPSQNLTISPPLKVTKIFPTNLATNYVEVQWEEDLRPNTTYIVNFGSAIVDNNEGNVLPLYSYVFSTGEKLDKGLITGTVDRGMPVFTKSDKTPMIVVQVYEEGTKEFGGTPISLSRVDEDGYFELDYLRPGRYELVAFEDPNANARLDAGAEDFYINATPVVVREDQSLSGLRLNLNRQAKKARVVEVRQAAQALVLALEGNPEKMELTLEPEAKVIHVPFSNTAYVLLQTKPSDGQVFALNYTLDGVPGKITYSWNAQAKNQALEITNQSASLAPGQDWLLQLNSPIENINPQGWTLLDKAQNPLEFKAKIDPFNPTQLLVSAAWKEGQTYQLTIPSGGLVSGRTSLAQAYRAQTQIVAANTLGSFVLKDYPAEAPYFLELWKTGEDQPTYRQYFKKGQTQPKLNFLTLGTFRVVIKKDLNGNGYWDAGDLSTRRIAEPLELLDKSVETRPGWEIVEPYAKPKTL